VTKVETRVDNAVVGDLLVEFDYSNYQNMNGVQVPGRIVQKQRGWRRSTPTSPRRRRIPATSRSC
jgi:hypothetical protein